MPTLVTRERDRKKKKLNSWLYYLSVCMCVYTRKKSRVSHLLCIGVSALCADARERANRVKRSCSSRAPLSRPSKQMEMIRCCYCDECSLSARAEQYMILYTYNSRCTHYQSVARYSLS